MCKLTWVKMRDLPVGYPVPKQNLAGDAGFDLPAAIGPVHIGIDEAALVPIGYGVEIPDGFVGLIRPRSGIDVKQGLTTGAGVIDSNYRGEVHVLLRRTSRASHKDDLSVIQVGDRIAQLIIVPYLQAHSVVVNTFETSTVRGCGGFGSSDL